MRLGEDISEPLDIVPAKFLVRRHVFWACWFARQVAGSQPQCTNALSAGHCGIGGPHADVGTLSLDQMKGDLVTVGALDSRRAVRIVGDPPSHLDEQGRTIDASRNFG